MADAQRCPNCPAEVSIWAGHCPECGNALPDAGAAAAEPTELSPPRRPRWPAPFRRRLGLALAALAVVVVAAGLIRPGRDHRPRPAAQLPLATPSPAPTSLDPLLMGRTLVETDGDRLRVFALDGRAEIDLLGVTATYRQRPVSIAGAIVFVGGGQAYVLADAVHGPPRALGAADAVFAAVNPGQVWLVRGQPPGPLSVQLTCVPGYSPGCGTLTPPISVPSGLVPVAQAGGDLLVLHDSPGTPALVWDPFSDTRVFEFPGSFGDIIDSHANLVAWRPAGPGVCATGDQCPLHIMDVESRTDQTIHPPIGARGYIGGGAFSSDGSYLAAFVPDPVDPKKTRPAIIHLGAAPTVDVEAASVVLGEPVGAAVWDPVGLVVFVAGLSGSVLAIRPGDPTPTVLPVPASYSLAVL